MKVVSPSEHEPEPGVSVVQVAGLTRSSSLDDIDLGALTDDIGQLVTFLESIGTALKEHA